MISVVIPVKNEVGNVSLLVERIRVVFASLKMPFELVFVDDGSTDGTLGVLRELRKKCSEVRVLELRRNFGKALALQAGFLYARGSVVFTMDGDLQDDPSEIPRFLAKLDEGYDVVSGWKKHRKDPLSKKIPSKFFNKLTSLVTGVRLHDFNCGFKAYRAEVTKSLRLYGQLHRYIPALAAWKGFRIAEIPVRHHPRKSGKSKYSFSRFLGAFDLITVRFLTQYVDRPLHLFGSLGLVLFSAGFLAGLYLSYLWFIDIVIWNRPLLILSALLMMMGIQFLLFGLLAEMFAAMRDVDVRGLIRNEY